MKSTTHYAYDSWDEFKRALNHELFPEGIFRPGQYFFRGVGNADWRLETSFDRLFARLPVDERMQLWQSLLKSFTSMLQDSSTTGRTDLEELAVLALGQHNGLPTRLLDWTLSPYVAAFFAFRNALVRDVESHLRVAVWILHAKSAIWARGSGVELVTLSPDRNERLRVQQGRFTHHHSAHDCLEDYVDEMGTDDALRLATMPMRAALQALPDLEAMGVHAGALFPDVSGIAEAATLRATYRYLADNP